MNENLQVETEDEDDDLNLNLKWSTSTIDMLMLMEWIIHWHRIMIGSYLNVDTSDIY